ncbi:ATP-binding protein [Litorilituus sediminis]|uniref:histidine kinase n=1 Tax=Litorilituus sediminis TaxID=718192 RepID=A0A4P6P5Q0_9GAMM|nr:ATP-binding protein [Litorilituus sediminis]QBG34767.1 two-component sensor histidine kinase [Litorilituus sediminis]
MKLGRSFFNLYFFIISTFIVFSWALDEVWNSYLEQDIESYTGYKTMLFALGDYVKKHPEHEWEDIINGAARRFELPLKLMTIAEVEAIDHSHHRELINNNVHIYYYESMVVLDYLIEDTDFVITLGPAKMPTRPRVKAIYRVLILATFGVIIFIWLWPMSRDLELLKKATKEFGQGDFTSKAPAAKSTMIAPMIASFNMMAARIKRLIDAHKELTNAVSHELRTPLARTKFALQMLASVKDEEKRDKYQQQIGHDIRELEELINEMLIYAAFDNDKPELNFVGTDINELVKTQIASHDQFASSIELVNHAPQLMVCCDGHFIDRAVNNFISNAIKYGNGQVRVTISQEHDQCSICVEDNGDGVPDEFKSVIFDAFSRGDQSRNRETGGFGLGLAIVARIMEWHKGQASIGDSELGGAAFTLTLPIKEQKAD